MHVWRCFHRGEWVALTKDAREVKEEEWRERARQLKRTPQGCCFRGLLWLGGSHL